jgi:hypothetical protein
MAPPDTPTPAQRILLLEALLDNEAVMLAQLAQVAGIAPPARLQAEPQAAFGRLAAFIDGTDFTSATPAARTWLVNRLGLYLARWFIARHGGTLAVQCDPTQRFYLHFVVTRMAPPVPGDARLDPFAMAADAAGAMPRIGLAALAGAATQALTGTHR